MKKPAIVAHRGGAALYPENTSAAFENAIRLGADEVECDVRQLADGKILVFHDFDMFQLTGRQGAIEDMTWEQCRKLIVNGGHEAPILLEDLADLLQPSNLRLHIEIKMNNNPAKEKALAAKSVEILREHKMLERTSAISFAPECLTPFIEAGVVSGPCLETMHLVAPKDYADHFAHWKACGYRDLSLDAFHSPAPFVEQAVEAGFTVGVWTVNGPARMAHWLTQPIAYITTDQPDLGLAMRAAAENKA